MMIEPTELRWSTTGGMQKVLLINPSKERRAIKVIYWFVLLEFCLVQLLTHYFLKYF